MSVVVQSQTDVTLKFSAEPHVTIKPNVSAQPISDDGSRQTKKRRLSRECRSSSPHATVVPSKRARVDSQDGLKVPATVQTTQTALVVTSDRSYRLDTKFAVPQDVEPNEVIIRSRAVGLNHIDWKSVEYNFCLPELPWITGREMAGVVERVGSDVTKIKTGDAVWTSTYYKDRRAGCFQELVVVPQHTVFTIPACLDFASAASLGVGPLTAAMSLWRWLGVPMQMESETSTDQAPATKPKEMMLVWGGSTVTGQTAIQIAAQAGIDVIAVCSKSTASLVSSLGATHIVTYTGKTDSEVVEEIVSLAGDSLTKAIDLVGAKTAQLVLQVIEGCGSKVDFAPLAFMSSKASVPSNAVVHTVEMKQFVLDKESEKYGMQLNDMLEQKALTLPKLRVLQGGLAAVEKGLKTLKAGELQGEKLVVTMG